MPVSSRASLRALHAGRNELSEAGKKALQAVRGLVGALSRTARDIEQRTGITNAQLFLLQEIAANPKLSVNALAARAMTHQSTASVVLSRLERRGLVERVQSPADGRSVVLQLTGKGRRLLSRAPTTATNDIVRAIGRMTPSEVRTLRAGICALGREAGFKCDDSPMLFQEPASRKRRNTASRSTTASDGSRRDQTRTR